MASEDNSERKVDMFVGITVILIIHVFGTYWWFRNDDLRPLFILPPKDITPFWNAMTVMC
jgi:hypothetical protein